MTPLPQQRLTERLKQNSYSVTAARHAVFDVLEQYGPLDTADIVRAVSGQVNRASVYRTLNLFERLHIIDRIQMGWKYKFELSDDFNDHHHHITCKSCGAICTVSDEPELERMIEAIAIKNNFKLISHHMELIGLCHKCQKHETPDA